MERPKATNISKGGRGTKYMVAIGIHPGHFQKDKSFDGACLHERPNQRESTMKGLLFCPPPLQITPVWKFQLIPRAKGRGHGPPR